MNYRSEKVKAMEEVYNKEQFYCDLIHDRLLTFYFEKPLNTSHLKPIEDVLFNGKKLTPRNLSVRVCKKLSNTGGRRT